MTATPVEAAIPTWLTLLLAAACGIIVANIYYAQPLIGPISAALGLSPGAAGLIVTMTQIGYGAGLLLVVPLGDLFENRRLVLVVMALALLGLVGAALAQGAALFLASALVIGLGSVAVQILVPLAAHLAPEKMRGRMVGNVMSGLMLGIMLARPVSSFATAALGSWHAIFWISAAAMVLLGLVLRVALPVRRPPPGLRYGQLLGSMGRLAAGVPQLRRRALYQSGQFGAFSLFWTTVPLHLAQEFHLTQTGIALFALAGVAGAVAAPIAGRVADRGWVRPASGLAMLAVAISFPMTWIAPAGSTLALGLLVAAAILLDFGVSANVVLGQRVLFTLGAEMRSRLNGLYMATFFLGGALGSALGGWSFATGGWVWSSLVGMALPVLALSYWATERPARRHPAA
ncbi:MFS transporter [Roseomonas sp. 18066]|uniref:MFS transporter n=1 Tax=Roseomonas sp. 18066 TaxID=2681412 RepID=UPI00135B572D|nr:MFS transporter [Roseomonas sp. 18066]